MRNKLTTFLTSEYPPLGNEGIFANTWKYAACMLLALVLSVGNMWAADFDITLDQFRTKPISGLVKIDDSNLSLSGGALQLSSGNKDFTVSTTNSDYKIKKIVFTTTKAIIKYSGDAISENTFQPAAPGTSFTLNLTASGGTAKITQMVVTLTTATSETLEELFATALDGTTYTTGSTALTLTTVGGTFNAAYINVSKSSNERSLTISAASGTNLKFVAIYYYDAIFSKSITASTGTYDAATYTWTPGSTPTNTVKLTFNTGNSEGAKIRKIYVGYEAAAPAATYNATFANGGHGTAPAAATGVSSVTLTELTESGWTNTGWTANKATKVGTTDKAAGATLNIGDVVTLLENTTFTAQWEVEKQTPTATFSNGTYDIAGGSALNLASLWTSNSSGAVTYTVEDANGTGAEISTASFTATTAGVAKVKAEQAANGAYSSITKYAYITVGSTADGEHTITWNAKVNTGGSTELQTASKISTSLRLTPANYAVTGLSLTSSNNSTCTDKIANTASEDADKYVSVSFTVADDYQFTPSNFDFKMVAVSKAKAIKVTISDTNGHSQSDTYEQAQNSAPGTNHTYDLSGSAYTGTVTIKIYVWRGEGVTADDGYRIGTPMTITGTVAAVGACTTPTITWNGEQPENAYVSDGSKTFVMNSNYAAGIAPELSENTCGATIAVKTGTDNKQWVVSFTSAGSVKITPKVVGDGTTVCAETVSGTAKTLTVTQAYDVTFNMNGHGAAIAKQVVADGAKAKAPFVADVTDWVFGGWFTDAGCTAGNEFDFANTTITADIPLYAKWTADACAGDRKSLSKVVLTAADNGVVTGYNGKEYAGDAVIGGLSSTETADVDASHDGVETGYKLNSGGSAIVFATLKKGTFQEGDKVVVTITKKQDSYKIESVSQPVLHIYYGTSKDDATKLTTLEGVSAAGSYTYRLTAADVATIGEKKGIGVFRESSNGQNPYVYSVEITGCRSFAVTHDVNFNMMGHGTAITKQTIEVGAKVTEPAEPEAAGYIFGGWYKENTIVNKWNFSTDVMPDNDITLYAKWTEDPCTDRQSLSKVVLTAADNGVVTGYNGKEYAGEKVIGGLSSTETAEVDASHDGTETGYKLSSGGSAIVFATLAKGTFQEGDKVVVTITKQQDNYKVDAVAQPILDIYYGTDKDDATFLTTIKGVNAAGTYTYRLTADDVTAIGEKKGIGVFRPNTGRVQNPYVYSVEITGCRSWAVSHTVSFNMHDHGSAIAPQDVFEGGKVTKPATPSATDWAFVGWYKEDTYENEWDFDTDVMGTSDITLHAKWESEVGAIKLFDGEGNLNTTNFVSPAKATITIDEVEYPTLVAFGSNRSSELKGTKQADMVQYNAATDAAKIKFELYNNNGSAKTAYLWLVEEGDETATPIEINVPGKTRVTTAYYTFNSTKNRSFYLTSGAKDDIKVMQVTVLDNGTAIHQFGQAGYGLNLNRGRIGVAANGTVQFEGARIHSNEEYSVLNSSNLKPKTYIQFNNAVANTVVKITKASSNKYYVTNDLDNKGDEYSTDKEIVLTTTGTWYIGSVNPGSVAALSKIEFTAPKCAEPAFNSLANSDLCEGAAFEALNGTATVGDAGTPIYQWYKADGDVEIEGATSATYTPTADGSYYVVATNQLAGYSDNSKKSNTVTVTHFAAAEITTAPLNQRGLKDAEVTLSVAATGKNLSYEWFTCDNESGDNPVAVVPAATGTSLSVTITEGMNQWYKVVVSSDCGSASATAKVEQFVPVAPANVTESTTWDWTSAAWPASGEAKFTNQIEDGTDFTPDYELLANANSIVPNNEGFHSDMLYGKGQWVWRSGNKFFQGTALKFTTTVPGRVRVYFRSTGNNKHVQVVINTKLAGTYEADGFRWSDYVYVPAGDVEIICTGTDVNKAMTRIQKIEFETPSYTRTEMLGNGVYGTICVDHNVPEGGIRGVTVYEIAGREPQYGKIAFDEITEMEAGVPYVFIAHGDRLELYYGATSVDNPVNGNGMYGTFTAKTLTELDDIYYFAKSALWGCADLTSLSLPANRAYVKLSEIGYLSSPNPAPGRRRIVMGVQGEQVATGMENVQGDEVQCTKVMLNGQLFILRGEKMYDATGRLVK